MNVDSFKKVCVVGFKQSGVALCRMLLGLKKKVKVSELNPQDTFSSLLIQQCEQWGVEFEFGQHSENFIKDCDIIVVSPGVDINRPPLSCVVNRLGILTVGEIEFSSWFNKARIVAITGTNGKTTTTFLTYCALKSKLPGVYLAGNIGIPLASFVCNTREDDIVVLEVSSFQLETIREFRPHTSCITNVEPDHFDRYQNFEEYVAAKKNIFMNQKETDYAVLNHALETKPWWQPQIQAKIIYFDKELNNENFSCAYKIASLYGISKAECEKVFSSFRGLPHRMQVVETIDGITFINDSKATNPSSTIWALQNITQPTILIAGGKDKGLNYSQLIPSLGNVKKINLFGEARDKIRCALDSSQKNIQLFTDLRDAIMCAFGEAEPQDVILLSPMCSSFDAFANYRERGKYFIKVVKELYEKVK